MFLKYFCNIVTILLLLLCNFILLQCLFNIYIILYKITTLIYVEDLVLYGKQYYIVLYVYFAASDLLSLEIKMRKDFPSSFIVPDPVYSPTSVPQKEQ